MPESGRNRPPADPIKSRLGRPLRVRRDPFDTESEGQARGSSRSLKPRPPRRGDRNVTVDRGPVRSKLKRASGLLLDYRLRWPRRILLFFVSPLVILLGIWASLFGSADDEKTATRAPAVVETEPSTVPTTTRNVVTTSVAVAAPPSTGSQGTSVEDPDWSTIVRSIVLLYSPRCEIAGSGTLVLDGSFILTNAHVATDERGEPCDLQVAVVDSPRDTPQWVANAAVIESAIDQDLDLAVVRVVDELGNATELRNRQPIQLALSESFAFAQEIKVIGYPGMGGSTISQTSGQVSGFEEDFVKTDAKMGPGVSGGAAFSADTGAFLGVPTSGSSAAIGSSGEMEGDWLGWIRPVSYAQPLLAKAKRSSN